jgi:hypothetical protein
MNPNREGKTGKARQIAKARSWRKVQAMRRQSDYWRQRWLTHPESMRSNLDRINTARKERAAKRTEAILQIISILPASIPSLELRDALRTALGIAGHPSTTKDAEKLLSNLRRRNLVRFDLVSLTWHILS